MRTVSPISISSWAKTIHRADSAVKLRPLARIAATATSLRGVVGVAHTCPRILSACMRLNRRGADMPKNGTSAPPAC